MRIAILYIIIKPL